MLQTTAKTRRARRFSETKDTCPFPSLYTRLRETCCGLLTLANNKKRQNLMQENGCSFVPYIPRVLWIRKGRLKLPILVFPRPVNVKRSRLLLDDFQDFKGYGRVWEMVHMEVYFFRDLRNSKVKASFSFVKLLEVK